MAQYGVSIEQLNTYLSTALAGGVAGTISDFTKVESPHIEDAYVRNLLSATTPLQYNSVRETFLYYNLVYQLMVIYQQPIGIYLIIKSHQ